MVTINSIDWYTAYTDINHKPDEIDTTSSHHVVYLRKDFEVIESTDPETQEVTKQWKYQEKVMTKSEYAIATNAAELTTMRHDSAVIDAYTLELIEGGII